jgi:amino-acid N-acetyltransferase
MPRPTSTASGLSAATTPSPLAPRAALVKIKSQRQNAAVANAARFRPSFDRSAIDDACFYVRRPSQAMRVPDRARSGKSHRAVIASAAVAAFTEKDFYLDEFRGRTLVFAIDRRVLRGATARGRLAAVIRELVAHQSRIVLVVGEAPSAPRDVTALRRWLGIAAAPPRQRGRRRGAGARRSDTVAWRADSVDESLAEVWQVLRVRALAVVASAAPALIPACRIAERLRVHKLVIGDPAGGLLERRSRKPLSFLDETTLDVLLSAGEAEFQGMSQRRGLLSEIDRVLGGGVGSVNLCKVDGLARELFTYEGSGTLFTRGDYCRIERLGIDDFDEVERLVERGQREGLLKPRSPSEIGELLLNGFGAWIAGENLAGIGALRIAPFAASRSGEITGLYTITRFKGEGIGYRLVRRLVEEARSRRLDFVFAVTTADRAAQFFRREGFAAVSAEEIPAAKWEGYDPARRARALSFRLEVR